jgi:hypothetical protein
MKRMLKSKPLIPLDDGSWVSGDETDVDPVYFGEPHRPGSVGVPKDISFRLVHSIACAHPARRTLFQSLGVRDCDEIEVARAILDCHGKLIPGREDALRHAEYLYSISVGTKATLDITGLWVYDGDGNAARGRQLYIRKRDPYNPSVLFRGLRPKLRYMSNAYGELGRRCGNEQEFLSWLCDATGIRDTASVHDVITQLRLLSDNPSTPAEEVDRIYVFLWSIDASAANLQ